MHKNAFWLGSVALLLVLTGCSGGGASSAISNANSGGSGSPQSQSITAEDLFSLDGSDVLSELEQDAGYTAQPLSVRSMQSVHTLSQNPGPKFSLQVTGGTASILRAKNKIEPAVAFLMTFRDSSGLCECSNDNPKLPKPYNMTVSNPLWIKGQPFPAKASTTVLLIGDKANQDSSNHGGTYAANVPKPAGSASFLLSQNAPMLGGQTAASVTFKGNALAGCPAGSAYVSWNPVAGSDEYFLDFLTHFNNNPKNGFITVGFVITNSTSECVEAGNFYSKAQYQVMLISSDVPYINVYTSQGAVQAPKLPGEIDFAVSPITTFNTP